eukprot:scaffold3623_cov144-Skeletonema_dohrnii-CCMP3373.AAC.2
MEIYLVEKLHVLGVGMAKQKGPTGIPDSLMRHQWKMYVSKSALTRYRFSSPPSTLLLRSAIQKFRASWWKIIITVPTYSSQSNQ